MPLIEAGQSAPKFELRDQAGKRHALQDYAGRTLVLYFYPKDDTSSCTAEACQFRDATPDFRHVKAEVLGVSPDDAASHRAFADKHALGFPLLADVPGPDAAPPVCASYGVWGEKSMYGRLYMGVVRTTYLIDAKGVVRRRWDNVKVKGHAAEVLAAVRALHAGEDPAAGVRVEPKRLRPTKAAKSSAPRGAAKKPRPAATKKAASRTASAKPKKAPRKAGARSHDSSPPFSPVRGSTGKRGPGARSARSAARSASRPASRRGR